MIVVWDEPKRATNLDHHGIDFADVLDHFDFAGADYASSYQGRFRATGFMGDAMLTVVFLPLGSEGVSIISARPASRKERRAYDDR